MGLFGQSPQAKIRELNLAIDQAERQGKGLRALRLSRQVTDVQEKASKRGIDLDRNGNKVRSPWPFG
jgi:hypothetical protein